MRLLLTALIFLAVSIPAQAGYRHRHHHYYHHYQHYAHHHHTVRHAHHRIAAWGWWHKQHAQAANRHHHYRRHARHNPAVHSAPMTVWGWWHKHVLAALPQPAQTIKNLGGGMVRATTAAGPIVVAGHLAERFQALIADFVAHGYKPRHIGCLAHGGHVPNSRHYAGAACDFDQTGWGETTRFMYHAHEIIRKHGLRDGCDFNDCGHVDDGKSLHYAHRWNSDDDS